MCLLRGLRVWVVSPVFSRFQFVCAFGKCSETAMSGHYVRCESDVSSMPVRCARDVSSMSSGCDSDMHSMCSRCEIGLRFNVNPM